MMSLKHKVCSALFLLVALSFQAHAVQVSNHIKEAEALTAQDFERSKPDVLLCFVSPEAESGNASQAIGKVIPGSDAGAYVCEYSEFNGGVVSGVRTSKAFKWLDVTHDQLASWLVTFATLEKSEKGPAYFALRCCDHDTDHAAAVCVQSTSGKGFEFGHEVVTDGQKSCETHAGALYISPYFHIAETAFNSCTGKTFSPDCHRCNGSGCNAFECSAFTSWDKCPEGSHVCAYQHCVANFCPMKPICQWDTDAH